MRAALAVSTTLLAVRAPGFWAYLLRDPSAVDGTSVRLWLVRILAPTALAGGLAATALALGRRAAALLRAPDDGLLAAALGLALLGQCVFLLGWAGGLTPAALALLVAAAAVAGRWTRPVRLALPALGRAEGVVAGVLAFAACACVCDALAPPALWDVRAYHLALPELGLAAGRFARVPWMIHSHWPHLMEALYALPLAAGQDGGAALLHFGAAALLVVGTFAEGRRAAGAAAGWTAALLLAGQPAFLRGAGTAHADAACALFAFAAASALAAWEEDGRDGTLLAAGLLAGACASAKMTGLAAIAGGMLTAAYRSRGTRAPALFAAASAVMVGPWLLKTWLETGRPFWPFGPGADAGAAALAARYLRSNRWDAPGFGLLLHDGPLFLLAPAAALAALVPSPRARATGVERVLWASAPFLLVPAWRHNEGWRFLMPLWPAAALYAGRRAADAFAAGRGAASALSAPGARRTAAALMVAGGAWPLLALSPNNALFAVIAPRPASALDADRRALWADRALDGLPGFYADAAAALTPGAKVLLFREVRGYRAGFDYLWGDPMNQALLDYRSLDPDSLYERLKALGVTHVLDHPGSELYREDPGYYDRRTLALMAECLRRHASVERERDGFVLYRLL